MLITRKSGDRLHVHNHAQDTWMTFFTDNSVVTSLKEFGVLELINEISIRPGMGLIPPVNHNMNETITHVLGGILIHQDSGGKLGRQENGEFRRTSEKRGIARRVVNGSGTQRSQFLQAAIRPDGKRAGAPEEQIFFPDSEREGYFRLIASSDGRDSSLCLSQDVSVYSALMQPGCHLVHEFFSDRRIWIHVVRGRISLRDQHLGEGDGAGISGETAVSLTACQDPSEVLSEVLMFDLAF